MRIFEFLKENWRAGSIYISMIIAILISGSLLIQFIESVEARQRTNTAAWIEACAKTHSEFECQALCRTAQCWGIDVYAK
jgi:hypothetical protein